MQLTYYGQSCFCVNVSGKSLLFDPYITPNKLARHININDINADYILLSHGHEDHVADAEAIAHATGATIIANYEVVTWFEKKGLKKNHSMNPGGKWAFDFGTVKCVGAVHSSSMPDESYGGIATGFVISTAEKNFYYSGDTALTIDMQLIPMFAKIDFSVLPIGDNYTMGAEEAAMAARLLQCNKVVGVHYDTFEYIIIDKQKATRHFTSQNVELLLPGIGETIEL
ncbi:MAG TPA: metal-dependent hydrolase [Ferruginibacter sp.]|nr:metal-dependent hydrolase [Ferruginibacter sp.]